MPEPIQRLTDDELRVVAGGTHTIEHILAQVHYHADRKENDVNELLSRILHS